MALADFECIDHFGDPAAEARACRSASALFDFSFLECAQVHGGTARQVVEAFTGRSLAQLPIGEIRYALRVDSAGLLLADLTVWRTGEESYEVMSARHEDIVDLIDYAGPGVTVTAPDDRATFAVQGPASLEALRHLGAMADIQALPYFGFAETMLGGIPCRIGRLGYSGEPGFEIICPKQSADRLWQALTDHARPAGFIALDMLRIEAGFVLFSNEFRLPVTPAEAGLGKFYDRLGLPPPVLALVSFIAEADRLDWPWRPTWKRTWTPSSPQLSRGKIVVTSACTSVIAGGILGLGYVVAGHSPRDGLRDVSGIFRNIRLTPLPYYDTTKHRPRLPWRHTQDSG
jgi:glycine cleavage system aminomethyltransferase T